MAKNWSRLEIDVSCDTNANNNSLQISNKVIGYFSLNENGDYCDDASQLKYLYFRTPRHLLHVLVNFDLNHLRNSVIKKDEAAFKTWRKLNNILTWISLHSSRLLLITEITFVTVRGDITKIMCSPYETKSDWTICAKYSNGIIYLNRFETQNDVRKAQNPSNFFLKCQTWGFKFEQYMLTNDPKHKPNAHRTLNLNEAFYCVFDRTIGSHRLIYGAEIDGIRSDKMLDLNEGHDDLGKAEFVELKTSRIIKYDNQNRSFRKHKMLKWWCQSHLAGVKTIVCGFRNDHGAVKTLQSYKVDELPILARGLWNKDECLNFSVEFFDFVKKVVLETNTSPSNNVWIFNFVPKGNVYATKITDDSSKYIADLREMNI